jgi:ABC-type branched-subunit amino acid transport system permease subunit
MAVVVVRAVARAGARAEARVVARVVPVAAGVVWCIVFSLTATGIRGDVVCHATLAIGVAVFRVLGNNQPAQQKGERADKRSGVEDMMHSRWGVRC